jgi:SOS response regulatory protein OraA/RecX
MSEIYLYALKLLRGREYTVLMLREKLTARFGEVPQEILDRLVDQNFLSDRRFAEIYTARRKDRGPAVLRGELIARGVSAVLAGEVVSQIEWPSLREALAARMNGWKLRPPLRSRDAARLFRALVRLGYQEDAIREEIEQLHDQQ